MGLFINSASTQTTTAYITSTAAVLHFLIKEVWNISIFCEFSKFFISSHNFMSNSLVQ